MNARILQSIQDLDHQWGSSLSLIIPNHARPAAADMPAIREELARRGYELVYVQDKRRDCWSAQVRRL